jgi:PglZ domain
MGIVTDYLRTQIAKQVDDNGIVVWYDPEKHYAHIADHLALPNTRFAQYKNSFFALRHEVDALLNDLDADLPPRLLVYVPLSQDNTNRALIELETYGVVMQPGQQPPTRNTKLAIVAKNALKPIVADENIAAIEKQVEAGKLTLSDLETWGSESTLDLNVLSVLFGKVNPQDIALLFLSADRVNKYDSALQKKNALPELLAMLKSIFDFDAPQEIEPTDLRDRLARHVLMTEFIDSLQSSIPNQLAAVKQPAREVNRDACISLVQTWRLRRDASDRYVELASRVETDFGLANIDWQLTQIEQTETFAIVERSLQQHIETALYNSPTLELITLAQARQSQFWSERLPDIQARWSLVVVAGQLLLECDRIALALKQASQTPAQDIRALVSSYAEGDRPWCWLDTYHRHMERRWHDYEPIVGHETITLEQLIRRARDRYMDVGGKLSETFTRCYQTSKFTIPKYLRQRDIYTRLVEPHLTEGKTAYVWVDALRYEMARELVQALQNDFKIDLQPAIATVPTITEIGMSALLPQADEEVEIVTDNAGKNTGKLGLKIDGRVISKRGDRVKFLQQFVRERSGKICVEAKLGNLLPKPKKTLEEAIRAADLVLVTSQEIDEFGETDNFQARRMMDEVLHDLQRGFRRLTELGVKAIIVAADHGYIYGEVLGDDMKLDPPGGNTIDLHRRAWVGHGGKADINCLRANLSDFGLGSDLEIVVPYTLACFKAKGASASYFHGAMSPQELLIPAFCLIPKQIVVTIGSEIRWELLKGSQKISTRFFSVLVQGMATTVFSLQPPKVRIEIRAKKEVISKPVSASYGFEEATGDVQLRSLANKPQEIEANTIALMIETELSKSTVSIHLLDAITSTELARISGVDLDIAI